MVDISVATAPVGPVALVALNHDSAKQVLPVKSPFTQATDQIKGHLWLLLKALTPLFEKPVVTHDVWLP